MSSRARIIIAVLSIMVLFVSVAILTDVKKYTEQRIVKDCEKQGVFRVDEHSFKCEPLTR